MEKKIYVYFDKNNRDSLYAAWVIHCIYPISIFILINEINNNFTYELRDVIYFLNICPKHLPNNMLQNEIIIIDNTLLNGENISYMQTFENVTTVYDISQKCCILTWNHISPFQIPNILLVDTRSNTDMYINLLIDMNDNLLDIFKCIGQINYKLTYDRNVFHQEINAYKNVSSFYQKDVLQNAYPCHFLFGHLFFPEKIKCVIVESSLFRNELCDSILKTKYVWDNKLPIPEYPRICACYKYDFDLQKYHILLRALDNSYDVKIIAKHFEMGCRTSPKYHESSFYWDGNIHDLFTH
jgi:hypothetical protein